MSTSHLIDNVVPELYEGWNLTQHGTVVDELFAALERPKGKLLFAKDLCGLPCFSSIAILLFSYLQMTLHATQHRWRDHVFPRWVQYVFI